VVSFVSFLFLFLFLFLFFFFFFFLSNFQKGVGDFPDTYAYDGKRVKKWSVASKPYGQAWLPGDVIGCTIDLGLSCDLRLRSPLAFFLNPPVFSLQMSGRFLITEMESSWVSRLTTLPFTFLGQCTSLLSASLWERSATSTLAQGNSSFPRRVSPRFIWSSPIRGRQTFFWGVLSASFHTTSALREMLMSG